MLLQLNNVFKTINRNDQLKHSRILLHFCLLKNVKGSLLHQIAPVIQ
jgi:hypothetical protein